MKAVNYYIIVDKIKQEPLKQNGLILTESIETDVRYLKGKVVSCGNMTQGLCEGDIIYYDKHAGHGISFDDKLYYVIKQGDVVIVE